MRVPAPRGLCPSPQTQPAQHRPADKWLQGVVSWTWKIKLSLQMETELIGRIRESREEEAIKVFAMNPAIC